MVRADANFTIDFWCRYKTSIIFLYISAANKAEKPRAFWPEAGVLSGLCRQHIDPAVRTTVLLTMPRNGSEGQYDLNRESK